MKSSLFRKDGPREFPYRPRYYDPEAGERTAGGRRRDFADELHREWSGRRRHTKDERHFPWMTVLVMVFFAVVLCVVFFKFFA